MTRTLFALATLLSSSSALAAVDLRTTLAAPAVSVYQNGTWSVTVKNQGNSTANSVSVVIQLPVTHTSPTVYVMGTVGTLGTGCSASGTTLVCTTPLLKHNKSKVWTFDLALPESTAPLVVSATASASVPDAFPFDNTASVTAALSHPSIAFSGDVDVYNEHCTGTGLTSFFECVVSPSSISSHDTVFHADNTLSIPYYGGTVGGTWSQPTPSTLHFEYTVSGTVVMVFDGWAVDAACWEGVVLSYGSTIPYSVCLN